MEGNTNLDDNVGDDNVDKLGEALKLPKDLMQDIKLYRQKKRNTREVTDRLLLAICKGRRVTLLQLSLLINRETEPLRRDFVAPLVRHGKLKFTTAKRTDVEQGYTAE